MNLSHQSAVESHFDALLDTPLPRGFPAVSAQRVYIWAKTLVKTQDVDSNQRANMAEKISENEGFCGGFVTVERVTFAPPCGAFFLKIAIDLVI